MHGEFEMEFEYDVGPLIERVGNSTSRSFPLVTANDVVQELWLWVLENKDKVSAWLADESKGIPVLYTALRRQGSAYAKAETKGRQDLTRNGKVPPC